MASTYRLPGAYSHDTSSQDLVASSSQYNITGIVGLGIPWKQVNNLAIVKGANPYVAPATSGTIYLSDVTPIIGGNATVGNNVKLLPTTSFETLMSSTYNASVVTLITNLLKENDDFCYVKLVNGCYELCDENDEGALKLVEKSTTTEGTISINIVMDALHSAAIDNLLSTNILAGKNFLTLTEGTYSTSTTYTTGDTILAPNGYASQAYTVIGSVETTGKLSVVADPAEPSNIDSILLPNGNPAQAGDILAVEHVGSIPGFYNYQEGTDYTINDAKTAITWIGTAPVDGSTYYVSYKQNKTAEDYEPKHLFSTGAIAEAFGPELDNGVMSQLTIAADLVLEGQTENGGGVICCQVDSDTAAGWKRAIAKMLNEGINTLIWLKQDDLSIRSYGIEQVMYASADIRRKERTTFITPIPTDDITTIVNQRKALMNDRVTYFANKKITLALTDETTQEEQLVEVDAIYAACNLSGIEGNPEYPYSEPQLRKQLSSRITLTKDQEIDPTELSYLGSNFLSLITFNEFTNVCRIEDIFTTDSSNVLVETRAVRRVRDLLRKTIRESLEQKYIGKPNTDEVAQSILLQAKSMLKNYVRVGEINDFSDPTGAYNSTNPKLFELWFKFVPILETKWIDIYIGISLSTGN